jgi:hypothetical protein
MASSTPTLLERIQAVIGTVTAFDGRLCCWANARPHDLRDIAIRIHADLGDVSDAMPVFERVKRGKKKAEDGTEEPED